jgi:hypothetical protein
MKRLLAAVALATLTHATFAGELILYADSYFQGESVTINDDTDLGQYGFNDRASSVYIKSGTWLLCEDANFGGLCEEFGPGEYDHLYGFNDTISSVRQVGSGHGGRERDNNRDGIDVVLCADAHFDGASVGLSHDVRALDYVDFNDRTLSIIVNDGEWEFCEGADFGGECTVMGPGKYDDLGRLRGEISSMRRVR